MNTIAHPPSRLKRIFERIAIPGWVLIGWKAIEATGTLDFIRQHIGEAGSASWAFLTSRTGNIAVILAGFAWLFGVAFRPRKERYDLKTLKGRTLQLRDEIQAFLNAAPAPAGEQAQDESRDVFLKRVYKASSRRVDYLIHGFAWRFHDTALTIYYQFGERGLPDSELLEFLNRPMKNEECYQGVLAGLTRLSEHSEEETGISNSGYEIIPFKLFKEGKNRGAF